MKILVWIVALATLTATMAAAAQRPLPRTLCGAPGGISQVSTLATSCCATLPCQSPLSFDQIPPSRHSAHT